MAFLIGLLGFYIVVPLLLIFINSFNVATIAEPPIYGLQAWRDAFSDDGIGQSLLNTIKVAFWRSILIMPTGVFIAWILARTNLPFARGIEFLFWISFMLPSIAVTYGWILLLDPFSGLINVWLQEVPLARNVKLDIYTFWGIIWVHFISGIDTKVILLTPTFRRMDASLEEAAEVSGSGKVGTMLRITLPLMAPAVIVVFLLDLVRILESFETELLLGSPWGFYVLSTKILDLTLQEPPLVNQAAALGSIVLLLLAVIVPLQRKFIHARQFTTVTGKIKPKLIDLGGWRYILAILIWIIIFLAVGIPVLSAIGGSLMVRFGFFDLAKVWTFEYWRTALSDPRLILAFKNTLIVAGSGALIGASLLSLVAYILARTRLPGRSLLDTLCWMPSAIPGALAGLGLLWMFLGIPIFRPLYGSLSLLVIASIMGGITLSTQILKANFIQLGSELEEASQVAGAGFWRTYFRIVLPLMAQTMVLVAVLKYLFAARNASTVIFLATSETRTLALLALDQIFLGQREAASITVLLIVLLTTGLALVVRSFGLKVGIRSD